MDPFLEMKLKGMLWDLHPERRDEIFRKLISDPSEALKDENILVRALNTLTWYELIGLVGYDTLYQLLDEKAIGKLFPHDRRNYYRNAKSLLSKYIISTAG
jgi:hypothetical protein